MESRDYKTYTFSYALLVYMCIIVVLITLIPFTFRIPEKIHITWSTDFPDLITNILFFLPIGFLFKLSLEKNKDRFCLQALVFGVLLSSAVELAQVFIPGRSTSVIDVITNGLGTCVGAMAFTLFIGRLKEGDSGRLFGFELPLMNLVYLLIPLMWLDSLSTGEEPAHLWFMLLLGLFGSGALASIYTHRFKEAGRLTPIKLSLFASSWFFVGSLLALVNFPVEVISFGIIIGVFVQVLARLPLRKKRDEKRFELSTLKILLPLYTLSLILLAVWPTTMPFQEWQFRVNFQKLALNGRIVFTFRFIELIAAFTLFGYMTAEMRGRKKESRRVTLTWVFFITLSCSVVIQMVRRYLPLPGFGVLEMLFMTGAGVYGGVIYRLQLAAIQRFSHSN